MFYSIKELVQQADSDFQGNIAELMIRTEFELTGREREEVILLMERNLEVMKASVELGLSEKKSRSGLTGGDAAKLDHYIKKGKTLSDFTVLSAARNAIAVNEHNAKMGLVCATPTAGSAGCLPAVLTSAIQKLDLTHEQQLDFLFAAGAFGLVCHERCCPNSSCRWNSLSSESGYRLRYQKHARSYLRSSCRFG